MNALTIAITSLALCFGYGYNRLSNKIDGAAEQIAEAIIEKESGIKIDFSESAKQKIAAENAANARAEAKAGKNTR